MQENLTELLTFLLTILLLDHLGWVYYFSILNNTQESIPEQE